MESTGSSPRGQVDLGDKLADGSGSPAAPMKIADRKRNTFYTTKSGDAPAHRKKKSRAEDWECIDWLRRDIFLSSALKLTQREVFFRIF